VAYVVALWYVIQLRFSLICIASLCFKLGRLPIPNCYPLVYPCRYLDAKGIQPTAGGTTVRSVIGWLVLLSSRLRSRSEARESKFCGLSFQGNVGSYCCRLTISYGGVTPSICQRENM